MFRELFRKPEDPAGPRPYRYQDLVDSGFTLAGNPDEVTRKIEKHLENTNAEHLLLLSWTGRVPRDVQMRSLETFVEKVMPRFDIESPPDPA
jgi:alkanesulfonate monooxygenase SsuD/methylene tetrahydromethanopterin reductase-like flavin-dependent oxidoreductase (luciferase family)